MTRIETAAGLKTDMEADVGTCSGSGSEAEFGRQADFAIED